MEDLGLCQRQAARFGIIRRTLQQDVPHRQQRRAVKARAVAVVVALAGGLVTHRYLHFALQQQAGGRLLLVLAGADLQLQPQLGNPLLHQLADHQRAGGHVHRLFAIRCRVVLQLLGQRLGAEGYTVDADDRPFLFTAGDQLRRRLELHRQGTWRGFKDRRRRATTATAVTATTSTSASHGNLLRLSAERFDSAAPGTTPAR
ncbi:hypothetical protein D3C80_1107730 [compost metagenome]